MLNTGLRTGEMLGLLNSDIDLENKTLTVRQGVKEISRRDGADFTSGREIKIGKPKSISSMRTVPLNNTAVEMIKDLRKESYYGENTPLVSDENGDYTRHQATRRLNKIINPEAGCRPARAQHLTNHGAVLCKERHKQTQRHHRGI